MEERMHTVFQIIASFLFFCIGIISLVMAYKNLFSRQYLPFHARASGLAWESLEKRLQAVIIVLMRITGLGFLITGLQLILSAIAYYFAPSPILLFAPPVAATVFCIGLSVSNYQLQKRTDVRTPWKGSLYSAITLAVGIVISVIS
jgi:hypothetical protein